MPLFHPVWITVTLYILHSVKKALNRLHLVPKAAARLLTGTTRREHITPILASLHWLRFASRIQHKALNGLSPRYGFDLLSTVCTSAHA